MGIFSGHKFTDGFTLSSHGSILIFQARRILKGNKIKPFNKSEVAE